MNRMECQPVIGVAAGPVMLKIPSSVLTTTEQRKLNARNKSGYKVGRVEDYWNFQRAWWINDF